MTTLLTPTQIQLPNDQDASGRTLGDEEMRLLSDAIDSGTLTATKGQFVKDFESRFAELLSVDHAFACSSGTTAIHAAVAAVNPDPGDEIITSPITDMGAIAPILYQTAVPVFADVDPVSLNLTAETIEKSLSPRTKAIIVTHLFGRPCNMGEILDLARSREIPVIEDCAQAFGARWQGCDVGKLGDIGCYSLQQGKHITTGEGGIVVTQSEEFARRMFLFINKAWGYGDPQPDHYFLALNGRMSELQGAVAVAQLEKLTGNVNQRIRIAQRITAQLSDVPGITPPRCDDGDRHTYWKYCLNVDEGVIEGGAVELGSKLREAGIACAPRYIQKPAFDCAVIRDQETFGDSRFPFTLARPAAVDYSHFRFVGAYKGLSQILVLPINERYTSAHADYVATSICKACQR